MNTQDTDKGEFPTCGCHYTVNDDGIHFCPLHKHAQELLERLKDYIVRMECEHRGALYHSAVATIARAEGKETKSA